MSRHVFVLIITLLTFYSCSVENSERPDSTGKGSEVLIVCDKSYWNSAIGDTIKAVMGAYLPAMNDAEKEFSLINVPYSKFSTSLQKHRNVLVIDISKDYTSPKIETSENVWSRPQRVIKMLLPDANSFFTLFEQRKATIKELFNKNERARFSAENALNPNPQIQNAVRKKFGIEMQFSKDYFISKSDTNKIWIRKETQEMGQGILIFTYPYKDQKQVDLKNIFDTIEAVQKRFIPGPTDGSYMKLAFNHVEPFTQLIQFNNRYTTLTRGLWETHGDFMGGPFINYNVVDEKNARIINFFGYVYFPNKEKRNNIRQLDAIINTANFDKPVKSNPK